MSATGCRLEECWPCARPSSPGPLAWISPADFVLASSSSPPTCWVRRRTNSSALSKMRRFSVLACATTGTLLTRSSTTPPGGLPASSGASRTRRVCSSEPPGAVITSSSSAHSPCPRISGPRRCGCSRRSNRVTRTWRFSHSGSRGVGNKIATRYSKIAEERRSGLEGETKKLSWLELSSEEGQEYWLSMRLAGRFAAAKPAVIHDRLARRIGEDAAFVTEHHHNFAFTEQWRGEEMIVHRKGATPAGMGVLGIMPGTMADTGYLTLGLGVEDSVNSASHGAGRRMSRTRAFKELDGTAWRENLREKGITLLGGALDEAPAAYKDVDGVWLPRPTWWRPSESSRPGSYVWTPARRRTGARGRRANR